ncbi:hypothetical protein ACQP2Y_18045 [Actinoplanes sp. CA-051413]
MSEADTVPSRGGPVVPSRGALRGFWGERQAVNSTATLAHSAPGWTALKG